MKVLLWQDVEKVGRRGETVEVREGFARNFLFPRKLASKDTAGMRKELEQAKRRSARQEAEYATEAQAVAEKLATVPSVTVEVNANEDGALYGAITPGMISEALREHKLKVDARCVEIAEPIKKVGTYDVDIVLHKDIRSKLKVWVITTKAVKPAGDAAKK
jgi:large subunit ribosomal protein L9